MEKRNKKDTYFGQDEIKEYLRDVNKYGNVIPREEELELLHRIRKGDTVAEEKLIYANLRYVIVEAKKFIGCGIDLADLINEGNYGLIQAARKFDVTRYDNKFFSYAVWWIRQSIFKAINEYSRQIRIPLNVSSEYIRLRDSMDDKSNGEILDYLGIPLVSSLNEKINADGTEFMAVISDKSFISPDEYTDQSFDSLTYVLESTMEVLDERETYIIKAFFGFTDYQRNLQEIADEINLTKERVRQIKDGAIRKLRYNSRNFIEFLT